MILERRYRIVSTIFADRKGWGKLLDIGCGNGAQTRLFRSGASRIVGLDILPLPEAEGAVARESFDFIRGEAAHLPFGTEVFDSVTAFEVLEHLPDDHQAVIEATRLLKPGGVFIFTVPNKWWIFETHGAVLPGLNWIPWNRLPFLGWLPTQLHERIARARTYTMHRALDLLRNTGLVSVQHSYITAPLDVLPDCALRSLLRWSVFRRDVTRNPLLAVNLFIAARKG